MRVLLVGSDFVVKVSCAWHERYWTKVSAILFVSAAEVLGEIRRSSATFTHCPVLTALVELFNWQIG
jgi:hypothetical protein